MLYSSPPSAPLGSGDVPVFQVVPFHRPNSGAPKLLLPVLFPPTPMQSLGFRQDTSLKESCGLLAAGVIPLAVRAACAPGRAGCRIPSTAGSRVRGWAALADVTVVMVAAGAAVASAAIVAGTAAP